MTKVFTIDVLSTVTSDDEFDTCCSSVVMSEEVGPCIVVPVCVIEPEVGSCWTMFDVRSTDSGSFDCDGSVSAYCSVLELGVVTTTTLGCV